MWTKGEGKELKYRKLIDKVRLKHRKSSRSIYFAKTVNYADILRWSRDQIKMWKNQSEASKHRQNLWGTHIWNGNIANKTSK